jgi:hypothetical protein
MRDGVRPAHPERREENAMDQSNKRGMESGSQKEANTRHGYQPAPETNSVPGAYGKHGGDISTEQSAPRTEKAEREKVDEG